MPRDCWALLDRLPRSVAEGPVVADLLHAVAAQLLAVDTTRFCAVTHLIAAHAAGRSNDLLRLTRLCRADLLSFDALRMALPRIAGAHVARALARDRRSDRLGAVAAALLLELRYCCGALLALHLEALAAALTFDALNMESPGATAATADAAKLCA